MKKSLFNRMAVVSALFLASNGVVAQGTLKSTLAPSFLDDPPLAGNVLAFTPEIGGEGPLFTVRYALTVNAVEPVFSAGRIAGGSTAWAFDLAAPTMLGGMAHYDGTTDMADFQISDMLANRTDFQIYAYASNGDLLATLSGPLVTIPEPAIRALLTAGIAFVIIGTRRRNLDRRGNQKRLPGTRRSVALKILIH